MADHAVEFRLADGTWLTVPEADLGRVYTTLWQPSDLKGAISTAALLIGEARKQDRYRQPIELTPAQSAVLREAVDRFADSDQSLARDPTPRDAVMRLLG